MEHEEILSDDERLSMLSQVFSPKPIAEKKSLGAVSPGSSSSPSPDVGEVEPKGSKNSPPLESFGSLLEKTLVQRQVQEKEEAVVKDEVRKQMIDESRKDMIGIMVKQFFR